MTIKKRIKQAERALGSDKPPYVLRVVESEDQPRPAHNEDGVPIIWLSERDLKVL